MKTATLLVALSAAGVQAQGTGSLLSGLFSGAGSQAPSTGTGASALAGLFSGAKGQAKSSGGSGMSALSGLFSGAGGQSKGGSGASVLSGMLSGAAGSSGFSIPAFLGGVLGQGITNLPGVLSGLASIATDGSVPLGPAPKGCAKYEVLIARGTFEPGPFGVVVGDPLMIAVKDAMRGEDVRGYAVQYPASMLGSDTGVKDVVNRVTTKSQECPNMKFVLVGYSQGGMVVSSAIGQIPANLQSRVPAMVLYGAGTGDGGGMGRMPGLSLLGGPSPEIKAKTMANCAPGDMCGVSDPVGVAGHLTYGNTGTAWHRRAAQYIASAFHGQPQGYKLEKSPT